jgi:signal transduction histidine kinase
VNDTVAQVTVEDNGQGIDAALLPRVFELFVQSERTPDRAQGGLGLGLSLVKGLMELHGGQVRAHSDGVGRGAVFTLTLAALQEDVAAIS